MWLCGCFLSAYRGGAAANETLCSFLLPTMTSGFPGLLFLCLCPVRPSQAMIFQMPGNPRSITASIRDLAACETQRIGSGWPWLACC